MMEIFNYDFDDLKYEVFPEKIWSNPLVVYHGTSAFHSHQIETNGLLKGYCPFEKEEVKKLISLLELPGIKELDKPNIMGMTISYRLKHYLFHIESDIRLSFAPVSAACVPYSIGEQKGGQIMGPVRQAFQILSQAIIDGTYFNTIELQKQVNDLNGLKNLSFSVLNSQGVIYAIQFKIEDLKDMSVEYNVAYSTMNVSPDQIIGKVIIPETITPPKFSEKEYKERIRTKLYNAKGLAIIIDKYKGL